MNEEYNREKSLEAWLRWCLENCDYSPEYNFGTIATNKIKALLNGEKIPPPDDMNYADPKTTIPSQ